MINFHPTDNDLLEFSSGNIDWALGICISAHLQLCALCKSKVKQYNGIGGSMLGRSTKKQVSDASFSTVMDRIRCAKRCPEQAQSEPETLTSHNADQVSMFVNNGNIEVGSDKHQLPKVIQKLISKDYPLKWSFVSPSLKAAQLTTGQNKYEVNLHRIKRGGKVAEHDHYGLEVTLVLKGSFSDADGNYLPGDFIVKEPGDVHRPMAAQDQDCLCLSAVAGPVKVKGVLGKIINPFLSINPR